LLLVSFIKSSLLLCRFHHRCRPLPWLINFLYKLTPYQALHIELFGCLFIDGVFLLCYWQLHTWKNRVTIGERLERNNVSRHDNFVLLRY
jgi:hypothetical protein